MLLSAFDAIRIILIA